LNPIQFDFEIESPCAILRRLELVLVMNNGCYGFFNIPVIGPKVNVPDADVHRWLSPTERTLILDWWATRKLWSRENTI
jgi:hypothetical protein